MANKITDTQYYQDIADAIREKNKSSDTYTPADMGPAIKAIPSGDDTLKAAIAGKLTGEVVIDYGNSLYPSPGCIIRISDSLNAGITKIKYICAEGAQEQISNPISATSSNIGYALEEIDFGNLEATMFGLGNNSVGTWPNVTKVTANKLKRVSYSWGCFLKGSAITKADFPVLEEVPYDGFCGCAQLQALILRNTTLVTLGGDYLSNTPIAFGTGYIYVPRDLISSYESATNWSRHAGQFRAIEDYTDDGTLTGEFIMPT